MGMKNTELGMIPSEWKVQRFLDTFHILSNNTLSRAELNYEYGQFKDIHYGDVLVLYPEVLDCRRSDIPFINEDAKLSGAVISLQDGDIVMADTAEDETVGKVTEISKTDGIKILSGLHTVPCRVKNGVFAPKYLGYYMNSHMYHDQLMPFITGIKVSSIAKSALANTFVLVPSLIEQERIVNALDDINILIENQEKLVEKHRLMLRGLISKMFSTNGDDSPENRLPGCNKKWKRKTLIEMLSQPVTDGPHETPDLVDEGIPFISVDAIVDNRIDFSRKRGFITREYDLECCKKYKPQYNDVYLVKSGSTTGKVAIVETHTRFNIWSPLAAMRCNADNDPYFLYYLLQTQYLQSQVKDKCSYGTQPNLSMRQLEKFTVCIPDYEEQREIGSLFRLMDRSIDLETKKLSKYRLMKQGMMEELLTGKVRLA